MSSGGMLRDIGVGKVFGYLPRFMSFAYSSFPLARFVLGLTFLVVILEYATLSLMLPLVRGGAGGSEISRRLVGFWNQVAELIGFPGSQQTWLWLFLVLLALRIAAGYVQMTLNIYVARQIHAKLSDKIFKRVIRHEPLAKVFQRTIGYYVSLAGDETHKAGNIFFQVGQAFAAALSAGAGLVLLLTFSPQAFWLTAAFIGICGVLLMRGMRVILHLSSESLDLSRALNTNFIEAMNGLRSIRSLSAENFVVDTYRAQIRRYVRGLFRIDALNQGYKVVPALILILIGALWLWPATTGTAGGTTLFFFAVTTMLIRILTSLGEFVIAGGKLVADIRASQGAGELLDADAAPVDAQPRARLAAKIEQLGLQNVTCGYDDARPVLRNVSVEFTAGSSYAIIGKSGAGKSTFADVVLAILPVSAGDILVNGTPLSAIEIDSLRAKIILVEQQTRIFTGTLRDNVTMGLTFSDDTVVESLVASGLREFLAMLPRGLDTVLDYQGANLSGGQRQRLGIARALVRHPDVLILDEGTSAVDPATRRQLVLSLKHQFADKILIFITHDDEVLRGVDEVLRVDNGALIQEKAMLAQGGARD